MAGVKVREHVARDRSKAPMITWVFFFSFKTPVIHVTNSNYPIILASPHSSMG